MLAKTGYVAGDNVLTSIDPTYVGLSLIDVYFAATTSTGATGIFTTSRAVIKTGDVVGGYQLIAFGSPAVNAFGDLTFTASFSTGIGLFNPPAVVFTQSYPLLPSGAAINDFGVLVYSPPGPLSLNINNANLISAGDMIGPYTINGIDFPVTLNDREQVAIAGSIAGASNALIFATPKH